VPYDFWVKFNNYQRAHYNMIEQSGMYVFAACGYYSLG
jgi:hypothetical protein